jgi:hypothetical protein
MVRGRSNVVFALIVAGGWAFTPGCGGLSRAHAPGQGEARQALEAALDAWQKGEKPDRLAAASPPVHPVDSQWQAGQALEGYQILADEPDEPGDPAKRFSVSLRLKSAKAETKTRYIVVGRGPVWVYREDDYARFLNMDNNPRQGARRGREGR